MPLRKGFLCLDSPLQYDANPVFGLHQVEYDLALAKALDAMGDIIKVFARPLSALDMNATPPLC